MNEKIELDFETADRIAVLVLKKYRKYLQKDLDDFKNGEYLHSEDVAENIKAVEALNLIIKHFDGDGDSYPND
jgi:hypothetical protein